MTGTARQLRKEHIKTANYRNKMRGIFKILPVIMTAIFWHTPDMTAQDKYDRVLESCSRIAAETGIGTSRDMQAAVDKIRNLKIEMPKEERLKGARNRIAKAREERFGPNITKSSGLKRPGSASTVGKPQSRVGRAGGSNNSPSPSKHISKGAAERDNKRIVQAKQGARKVHQGTKDSFDKTQNEIANSDNFIASYNPQNYVVRGGGQTDDDHDFREREPEKMIGDIDIFSGLEDEPEPEAAEPRNFDIEELLARFEKDENSLDCEELDYMVSYLDDAIAKLKNELDDNNEQISDYEN